MKNKLRRAVLVIRHALAMWRALNKPKNAAKGDWQYIDHHMLFRLLKGEVSELHTALWDWNCGHGSAQRVAEEAADVGNYAAMIADITRRK